MLLPWMACMPVLQEQKPAIIFFLWQQGLQREHFLALLRTCRYPVGNAVPLYLLQRVLVKVIQRKVAVLNVLRQYPCVYQKLAQPLADLHNQVLQLIVLRHDRVVGVMVSAEDYEAKNIERNLRQSSATCCYSVAILAVMRETHQPCGEMAAGKSSIYTENPNGKNHVSRQPIHRFCKIFSTGVADVNGCSQRQS